MLRAVHDVTVGFLKDPTKLRSALKVSAAVAAGYIAVKGARRLAINKRLAAATATKRVELLAEIQRTLVWACSTDDCPPPSNDEVAHVTSLSVAALRIEMKFRRLHAVFVLKCFLLRALEAHATTNCLTAIMLDDAIAAAQAADASFDAAEKRESLPHLLGIPMTIKESIAVIGTDSTMGLASLAHNPAEEDSPVVTLLRRAGATIFAKTNVPQLLLSYECDNPLFGKCTNPFNSQYGPGGSSGGEGAILALRGSAAGIGSDVGGSIRIPASFCGVCGLKPSHWRVSTKGGPSPLPGLESLALVYGPMGRSVQDLTDVFRALTPHVLNIADGSVMNVPFQQAAFDEAMLKKVLRIGYYVDDGFVMASPACARAVTEAVAALSAAGHECVAWVPPGDGKHIELYMSLIAADSGRTPVGQLRDDAPNAFIAPTAMMAALPNCFTSVASVLARTFVDKTYGRLVGCLQERKVDEFYQLLDERDKLRHSFAASMQGFDFIIGPTAILPAVRCGSTTQLPFGASYTMMYNVVDLPVVALPVTKVDPLKDEWSNLPPNTKNRVMVQMFRELYDASQMAGLPVGVQVITPRFTEERALAFGWRLSELVPAL